jgi:hypothetical protein
MDDGKKQDERAETRRVEDRERTVRNVVMLLIVAAAWRTSTWGGGVWAAAGLRSAGSCGGPPRDIRRYALRDIANALDDLKALETSFDADANAKSLPDTKIEIERIEDAVSHIRFPLTLRTSYTIYAVTSTSFGARLPPARIRPGQWQPNNFTWPPHAGWRDLPQRHRCQAQWAQRAHC